MGRKIKRVLAVIDQSGEQDSPVRTKAAGNMQEKCSSSKNHPGGV